MKDFIKFARSTGKVTTTEIEDYIKWMNKFKGLEMSNAHQITSQIDMPSNMTPNIVEERPMNVAVLDVFSRLMKDRIIFLGHGIDSQIGNILVSQILYCQNTGKDKKIDLYINSPGGEVYAGLGIYGTMQYTTCPIHTFTTGIAASMAYVLAVAGEEGHRSALPYARLMQHQPMGGARGQATDIAISNKEIHKLKYELYEIISHHTGKDIDQVYADCERDHWMRADEAKEYGALDNVVTTLPFTPTPISENKWTRGMMD